MLIAHRLVADVLGSFYWLALTILFLNLDYRKIAMMKEGKNPRLVTLNRLDIEGALR